NGPCLILVDVWAHWCMASQQTAPGLVEVYRKYKDRGVAFVSLSNAPHEAARWFAERASVPWPCGYAAPLEELARFGAYNRARWSPNVPPGYEVTPTLYLLGADGHV